MSTTTAKPESKFKTAAKNAGHKTKEFVGKQATKVKKSAKNYGDDLTLAHDIGYASGWDVAHTIPDRLFAQTAAAYGFKKGVRNKKRTDKYVATYQKKGTKN